MGFSTTTTTKVACSLIEDGPRGSLATLTISYPSTSACRMADWVRCGKVVLFSLGEEKPRMNTNRHEFVERIVQSVRKDPHTISCFPICGEILSAVLFVCIGVYSWLTASFRPRRRNSFGHSLPF